MKKLLPILFLFAACSAFGAGVERISLLITVTNTATTSNTLTINATTRYWTNASTLGTILTNLVSTNHTTTNLFNQIASFPYTGPLIIQYASSNQIRLIGPVGGALAGSASGGWATITLSTQSGPQTYTALWPLENMVGETNRTNQGSALVSGLSTFSTNAFATNATANSNFITKGASPDQFITSPLRVTGTLRATSQLLATNGYTSALTNINSVSSNHVNYGNAIRSEGIGGNSLQVGSNALALGTRSLALGNSAVATNTDSVAIGTSAAATNTAATAIGNGVVADGALTVAVGSGGTFARGQNAIAIGAATTADGGTTLAVGAGAGAAGTNSIAMGSEATVLLAGYSGIAIGEQAQVSEAYSIAVGFQAAATHSNSVAIGKGAATTKTNEIMLGTSTETVSIPGQLLISGSQSNTTFRGTNVINARVDFTSRAYTGMVNGNNGPITLGTNTYVRLSGATTIGVLCSFEAEQDGSYHIVKLTGAITNTVANESGFDGTVSRRIITGTGGDVSFTNNPCILQFLYDATLSRWQLMGLHR